MKNADIAFFILSFDNFKVTWKPCIDHLFNAWPNCPYPVYLLNNYKSCEDKRVKNLLVGEDLNWSDTLKKGLLKVKEKSIFFLYDDAFITRFDIEEIELIFKIAIENDMDSVALRRRVFDRGKRFNEKIYKINSTAKYRNSLFLNLIKKDILLNLLKSGESNWQFEKDGNKRSENYNFFSVLSAKLVTYKHGIVKGKWLPKTYNYLKREDYLLEENTIQIHNFFRILYINIYTIMFYIVHGLTHFIKRN